MLLSDMGADVVTLVRVGDKPNMRAGRRGRRIIGVDLKDRAGHAGVLELLASADALIEGFRPGVMERLGLGPEAVLARNPKLVYGRMTGWGQDGPLAHVAGHDINYISITGALAAIGPADRPVPPLNLVGDFGGGALYLVVGILAAVLEAGKTGKGQVVDAAMCDGTVSLMSFFLEMRDTGTWSEQRERNLLDGGAHFYGVYECACGNFISIGPLEPQFYSLLCQQLGLNEKEFGAQMDREGWPGLKEKFRAAFRTRTREEWCRILEGSDSCFAPVLTMSEAKSHPHLVARKVFVEHDGVTQPAPAPRFSRTPAKIQDSTVTDIAAVLQAWQMRGEH